MRLSSPAFTHGQSIPLDYTCDGENVSPPLEWEDVPESAKSLALICEDPDAPAGTWIHWVVYGIPPTASELSVGVPRMETISSGAKQGTNSSKRIGYTGPCPPPDGSHRYFFRLFALGSDLGLGPGLTKQDLLARMQGHIIAEAALMGTYKRRR